jgi:glycosyltransferase involved in cell wall biosynthesis
MEITGGKMDSRLLPLVSIVTPVYNDAANLAECIESVLAQTYQNWDYTIVDNCSTDGSVEIARRYAAKDSRIRVHENEHFLRAIPNHNVALRQISPESKYCKIVFADDWIFPQCLEQMLSVAEEHPSVGIVGAYGLQEHEVMWAGLPYPSSLVSGRAVCRKLFLDGMYVFGTSTSVLYRSDLVRSRDPFYNEANLHADMEACVVLLKTCDFGFVHQILTFKRMRLGSLGTITEDLNTLIAGHLHNLLTHGSEFLTKKEYEGCLHRSVCEYYNFLAVSLMQGRRDKKFWDYHKRKLTEAGVGFGRFRLARAALARLCRAVLSPYETIHTLRKGRNLAVAQVANETVGASQSPVRASGIRWDKDAQSRPGRNTEPEAVQKRNCTRGPEGDAIRAGTENGTRKVEKALGSGAPSK